MQELTARLLSGTAVLSRPHDPGDAAPLAQAILAMTRTGIEEVPAPAGPVPRPVEAPDVLRAQANLPALFSKGRSMTATEYLKSQVGEDWTAATTHAFTDALASGSLKPEEMAGYLQQDYQFIDGFVRLLASAIAHAPTLADSVPAAQFLAVITGPENTYFLRSFKALEIPVDAPAAAETRAFQDLMREARLSGRYEIMLAVLVVAEWIYLDWASPAADRVDNLPFWLGEWITLHSGKGFESVVAYLRSQLDAVWGGLNVAARAEVEEIFCKAVRLERAFFDAAWRGFAVTR
jgi:thiaminase (transcriptional activator TenA)